MDRRLSIAGSRNGYLPFTTRAATLEEIEDARRVGPFTRAEVLALLWRVKKFSAEASLSATGEKEVYNEATETFEPVQTPFTAEVDKSPQMAYRFDEGTISETVEFIPDEELVEYLFVRDHFIVFADPAGGVGSHTETAGMTFYFGIFEEVWKDPSGGHWLALQASARKAGLDAPQGTWTMRSSDDPLDPSIVNQLHLTGQLIIGAKTVNLKMIATTTGSADTGLTISVESAAFTLTAVEWRPYATSSGAAAWSTTTGAPVNGGPGA